MGNWTAARYSSTGKWVSDLKFTFIAYTLNP